MDFFEQELRKIVGSAYPNTRYVGRAAYVNLGDGNRAKFEFVTLGYADNYEAIRGKIINQRDGEIDVNVIRLGRSGWRTPTFPTGSCPTFGATMGNTTGTFISPRRRITGC